MSAEKNTYSTNAVAKTNLSLEVLGKRDDGFHEIITRMIPLSLSDRVDLTWTSTDSIELTCSDPDLPTGEDNLAIKAVRALEHATGKKFSLKIHIEKSIPSGAGLGGGSSDAAAVLRLLNDMASLNLDVDQLAKIAAEFGSDIPFFVYDSACDCTGRGEFVTPIAGFTRKLPVVLLKPAFGVSAGWAYQNFQGAHPLAHTPCLPQVCPWGIMKNDLELPVFRKHLVLARMKTWLLKQPTVHASIMSGSGSTMLAVLNREDAGVELISQAKLQFGEPTWGWAGTSL